MGARTEAVPYALMLFAIFGARLAAQSSNTSPESVALSAVNFARYAPGRALLVDTVIHQAVGDAVDPVHDARFAALPIDQLPRVIASMPLIPARVEDRVIGRDTAHVSFVRLVDRTGPSGDPVVIALVLRAPHAHGCLVVAVVRREDNHWTVQRIDYLDHLPSCDTEHSA